MKFLLIVCLLAFNLPTTAQDRIITGRILDKTSQQPIKDANIIVEGSTSGTISNSMGYFQINLKSTYKSLLISHVSYQAGSILIPATDKFKIELEKIFVVLPKVILYLHPPELAPFKSDNKARENNAPRDVEQSASYLGGLAYLNYYLTTNYKFPEGLDSLLIGKASVSFEVGKSGVIDNVKVYDESIDSLLREHLVNLFLSMPVWRPAYQRGEQVRQNFVMPIVYGADEKSDETATYLSYYLSRNLIYPAEAIRLAVEGTVFVYFALNSSQDITELEILQGIGSGCDRMVYNVINAIPKAELKSLMTNIGDSIFVIPVDFRLDRTSSRRDQLVKLTSAIFLDPVEVMASQGVDYYGRPYKGIVVYPTREFYSVEGALKHINNALRLRILNQQLTSLSPDLGKLIYLNLLDLENNQLKSLPKEIAELTNLKEFYAPKNSLNALPNEMSEMRHLKIVGLSHNKFSEFPPALLSLKRLQALDLSNNKLSSIPAEISKLKNLKILLLRNNNLQSLPDEFFKLKLDELFLEGNNLPEELKLKINESFKNAKISL